MSFRVGIDLPERPSFFTLRGNAPVSPAVRRIECEQRLLAALLSLPPHRLCLWLPFDPNFSEPLHRHILDAMNDITADGERVTASALVGRIECVDFDLRDYIVKLLRRGFEEHLADELPGLLLDLGGWST